MDNYLRNSSRPPPGSLSLESILFSPHLLPPSLPACVRQLSGLLPVKLHERTGGGTFLLNIALHSGDSLPCLPLSLSALCFFLLFFLSVPALKHPDSSPGQHFYVRAVLLLLCALLSQVITATQLVASAPLVASKLSTPQIYRRNLPKYAGW